MIFKPLACSSSPKKLALAHYVALRFTAKVLTVAPCMNLQDGAKPQKKKHMLLFDTKTLLVNCLLTFPVVYHIKPAVVLLVLQLPAVCAPNKL